MKSHSETRVLAEETTGIVATVFTRFEPPAFFLITFLQCLEAQVTHGIRQTPMKTFLFFRLTPTTEAALIPTVSPYQAGISSG